MINRNASARANVVMNKYGIRIREPGKPMRIPISAAKIPAAKNPIQGEIPYLTFRITLV